MSFALKVAHKGSVALICKAMYSPHIFPRMVCPAMDAGDKLGALVQLGLGIILRIVQCLGKGIVFGLVRVGCIVKDAL